MRESWYTFFDHFFHLYQPNYLTEDVFLLQRELVELASCKWDSSIIMFRVPLPQTRPHLALYHTGSPPFQAAQYNKEPCEAGVEAKGAGPCSIRG